MQNRHHSVCLRDRDSSLPVQWRADRRGESKRFCGTHTASRTGRGARKRRGPRSTTLEKSVFKIQFYFRAVLYLQENPDDGRERPCAPHVVSPLGNMVYEYVTFVPLHTLC